MSNCLQLFFGFSFLSPLYIENRFTDDIMVIQPQVAPVLEFTDYHIISYIRMIFSYIKTNIIVTYYINIVTKFAYAQRRNLQSHRKVYSRDRGFLAFSIVIADIYRYR